jgi:hypothetical protein
MFLSYGSLLHSPSKGVVVPRTPLNLRFDLKALDELPSRKEAKVGNGHLAGGMP